MPMWPMPCIARSQLGSVAEAISASRVWCRLSDRPQMVVVRAAAKLPAVRRAKFDKPVAEGIWLMGTPFRVIVTIETKNTLMATPCTSIGTTKAAKLTSAE